MRLETKLILGLLIVFVTTGMVACGDDDAGTSTDAVCGNGIHEAGEECDDGNLVDEDGCSATCTIEQDTGDEGECGDGTVDDGEECDDGNTEDGDGCDGDCVVEPDPECGDGIVDDGEECDDANDSNTDACVEDCMNAFCGDGFEYAGVEECDDGNTADGDGCSAECNLPSCGNSIVEEGEDCDDGNNDNNDECLNTCQDASCGDGFVQNGVEECDDGNGSNSDECINTCMNAYCGDGFLQIGVEACDDGNTVNDDTCTNLCNEPSCGDGIINGFDQCDDGNLSNNDDCLNTCLDATCGDGYLNTTTASTEVCDDGNQDNTDACLNACLEASCGDGYLQIGVELCDDGNNVDTDACTNLCTTADCGDGVVGPGEDCDDQNQSNNDACLNTCLVATCGDGYLQTGVETCDDGDQDNTNSCLTTCLDASCGDGFTWAGNEACDDGNTNNTDDCTNACTGSECGDGIVQTDSGEECDDQNASNSDGCLNTCLAASCGDNYLYIGQEVCDDGNQSNADACLATCVEADCGDGYVWTGQEECDDSNTANQDGCSSMCTVEECMCGNGLVESSAQCETFETITYYMYNYHYYCYTYYYGSYWASWCADKCTNVVAPNYYGGTGVYNSLTSECTVTVGDGFDEECDDANYAANDSCVECRWARCGDGSKCDAENCADSPELIGPEECDLGTDDNLPAGQDGFYPGFNSNSGPCKASCEWAECGDLEVCDDYDGTDDETYHPTDGVCSMSPNLEGPEECEDGNTSNIDSCLNSCDYARCHDGWHRENYDAPPYHLSWYGPFYTNEDCDDGNTLDNDDCVEDCNDGECGDGNVNTAGLLVNQEECDDNDTDNNDACLNTCLDASCGDGYIWFSSVNLGHPIETCDDGNTTLANGTTDMCGISDGEGGQVCAPVVDETLFCGDGIELQELDSSDGSNGWPPIEDDTGDPETGNWAFYMWACDDGNTSWNDVCLPTCQQAYCGDAHTCSHDSCDTTNGGPGIEECDDGNTTDGDGCNDCVLPNCGNGILDPGEECDDGDSNDNDYCPTDLDSPAPDCVYATCGDGVLCTSECSTSPHLNNNEACDLGADNSNNGDCVIMTAWDSDDDGNPDDDENQDTCVWADCQDGHVHSGTTYSEEWAHLGGNLGEKELCDDGNSDDLDGCNNECIVNSCGDGIVQGDEQCDDQNTAQIDDCLNNCMLNTCHDGYWNHDGSGTEELCDDGNMSNGDYCVDECVFAECGDEYVCDVVADDGNDCDHAPDLLTINHEECDEPGSPWCDATCDRICDGTASIAIQATSYEYLDYTDTDGDAMDRCYMVFTSPMATHPESVTSCLGLITTHPNGLPGTTTIGTPAGADFGPQNDAIEDAVTNASVATAWIAWPGGNATDNWDTDQPTTVAEECIYLSADDGTWTDELCPGNDRPYVCEYIWPVK